MAKVGMTVNYGTRLDLTGVKEGLQKVQSTVESSKPLEFNIKSTGTMATQVGDAKKFFDEIDKGTDNLEKLTVKYAKFKDMTKGGEIFRIPISALKETRDATGRVVVETEHWNAALVKATKANKDYVAAGTSQATLNAGTASRKATAEFNTMKKSIDANVVSAGKFIEKSKNMSGKQVEDTKKMAKAILDEKVVFDNAFSAKQWDKVKTSGERIKALTRDFEILKSGTDRGANAIQGWATRISNAIKQTISYGLSIQLVREAQELLNGAIKYAIELNTEMTKIQVLQTEGAQTPEQINALAQSFNKLGQEMGASTLEIAKGSVEWLRQGKTVDETQKLLIASLQLSKLGAMDAADATNYLTSIMFAFNKNAEEASTVVDKLIAVDNIAATSAGELATALRYTSESAQLAGVNMEQLISYIGTVSSVTRQNAEMIGQAFKTMFARMTLMAGGGEDEFGVTISKVEKALSGIGVAVRDTNDELLPMGNILETVAGKWSTLTDRQRTEIAVAVAGVRQKEAFLVLMNNMNKAYKYQAAQVDSLGLAQDRYGIYLDSVAAKQGMFTAKLEHLKSTIVSDELVKGFYDIANSFLDMIDNAGGLIPVLTTVLGLFVAIKGVQIASAIAAIGPAITGLIGQFMGVAGAAGTAGTAATGFTAALGPIGIAIAVIGIAITGYNLYMAENKKKLEEATIAVQDYIDEINQMPQTIKGAKDTIKEINEILAIREESRTAEQVQQLIDLFNQLYEIIPNMPEWKWKEGQPSLDAAFIKTLDITQAIKDQTYASLKDADTVVLTVQTKAAEVDKYTAALERAEVKRQFLAKFGAMINNEQITTWKQLQDEMAKASQYSDTWTDAQKKGWEDVENAVSMFEWLPSKDYGKGLLEASDLALTDIGTNTDLRDKATSELTRLISFVSDDLAPVMQDSWKRILSMPPGTITDVVNKVKDELPTSVGDKSGGREDAASKARAREAARLKAIEDGNTAYEKQIKLIKAIATGLGNILKIDTKTAKGQADMTEAMGNFKKELDGLEIEGLVTDFDKFYNTQTQTWDTAALENWARGITLNKDLMDQIIAANPEWAQIITDFANDSLRALGEVESGMVSLGGTISGLTELSKSEFSSLVSATVSDIWSLVSQEGIALTTSQGQVITTEAQLQAALSNGLITYDALITQLAAHGSAYLAQFNKYIADSVNYAKNPFTSLPPGSPVWTGGGGSGGGGGSAPPNPRIKEIEKEIEEKQKEIKALQDQIKAYKEYIDAQKESLKRAKDEADFLDELAKKHKALGKMKARLAILALDDSEEAQKERLELEQQAADAEIEIKEFVEDRKYELMVQALEDMQKAFEDATNAQIAILQALIDKLNEEKDDLSNMATGAGGGGSYPGVTKAAEDHTTQVLAMIEKLKLGHQQIIDKLNIEDSTIAKIILSVYELTGSWNAAYAAAEAYLRVQEKLAAANPDYGGEDPWKPPIKSTPENETPKPAPGQHPGGSVPQHFGGLIEEHHRGEFAGNLMSNEVFAKLLKGEYVATEAQMSNFLKNTLPKLTGGIIAGGASKRLPANQTNRGGDMNIEISINVAGSLDRKAIPNLKKEMIDALNKTMERRGIRRTATNFTV